MASPCEAAGCSAGAAGHAAEPVAAGGQPARWPRSQRGPLCSLPPAAQRPVAARHWSQRGTGRSAAGGVRSAAWEPPLRAGAAHTCDKRGPDNGTVQVMALAREGAKYGVMVIAAGAMLTVKKPAGK